MCMCDCVNCITPDKKVDIVEISGKEYNICEGCKSDQLVVCSKCGRPALSLMGPLKSCSVCYVLRLDNDVVTEAIIFGDM